ncbi:MAG TPA: hypothetical protein PKL14_06775 [Holophaga sp.]|nr:hypothetical protein [Holophaga sp.]
MHYEFGPGDRVRLTRAGVTLYGGAWPHWVPETQGGGSAGTVLMAADRPHKPGASPRPYYVRWDNGVENSYRVEDLEAAEIPDEASDHAGANEADDIEDEAGGGNVIPFRRF